MTSKLNQRATEWQETDRQGTEQGPGMFPAFPPRDDMQNPLYLYVPGYRATLSRHFGSPDTTLVFSEVPVGHDTSHRRGILIPDLIVAFGVNAQQVIDQWGYAIDDHGKPPDFVLEIASPHTYRNDIGPKREGYQAYGVPEYWRYDGSGGRWYPQALAGDRPVNGAYQPITIETQDDSSWGYSEVLGLTLCREDNRLRFWDPVESLYLRTHDEEANARELEREARISAEDRVRQLEEEVARLRQSGTPPTG